MKSLLWVSDEHSGETLYQRLTRAGFNVETTASASVHIRETFRGVDAIIWSVPSSSLSAYQQRSPSVDCLPQLWRCDGSHPNKQRIEQLGQVDGILYDRMDDTQIRWALKISVLHHRQRTEHQRLERKLEERKWIEQAKWILHETKQLSEAEAYQIIRKQAMDERKPMADIAQAIVRVHHLLHSSRSGGE